LDNLGRLGEKGKPAIPIIIRHIIHPKFGSVNVRIKAIETLGLIGRESAEAEAVLIKFLHTEYWQKNRAVAVQALESIGTKSAKREISCYSETGWGCECIIFPRKDSDKLCHKGRRRSWTLYGNKEIKPGTAACCPN